MSYEESKKIDIVAPEVVQVVIRHDEKVVWINTEKGCLFRACQIKSLLIDDRRHVRKRDKDPILEWLRLQRLRAVSNNEGIRTTTSTLVYSGLMRLREEEIK